MQAHGSWLLHCKNVAFLIEFVEKNFFTVWIVLEDLFINKHVNYGLTFKKKTVATLSIKSDTVY